jgi:N-dimethylarginine dimethylaminohydrolase
MRPEAWARNPIAARLKAWAAWTELHARLSMLGARIEVIQAEPGLPDLVFTANAAIVLDGRVLLARFRHPQRRSEEPYYRRFFERLEQRGLIAGLHVLPQDVIQEGAGDCIWDRHRHIFWAGHGQRSGAAAIDAIRGCFGQETVGLELVTPDYYHLDTCFLPLPNGEVAYYPDAFSSSARDAIASRVPAADRIVASAEEAASFSLNAVAVGRDLVMAPPPARLRRALEERGYRCQPVDLASFMLSGGAAYCMTLRLDLRSPAVAPRASLVKQLSGVAP